MNLKAAYIDHGDTQIAAQEGLLSQILHLACNTGKTLRVWPFDCHALPHMGACSQSLSLTLTLLLYTGPCTNMVQKMADSTIWTENRKPYSGQNGKTKPVLLDRRDSIAESMGLRSQYNV